MHPVEGVDLLEDLAVAHQVEVHEVRVLLELGQDRMVGVLVEHEDHHPLELQVPGPGEHHGSHSWSEPSDGSEVVEADRASIWLLPKPSAMDSRLTLRFRFLGCRCAGGSWGIPWRESGGGNRNRWCELTISLPGSFPRGGPSCRRRNHRLYSGATRYPDLQVLLKGLEEVVVPTRSKDGAIPSRCRCRESRRRTPG